MKLETYLRLAGIPYTVYTLRGRPGSATGKAPYIDLDGKHITDSSLIIEHLEHTGGHKLDGRLTLAQRAESLAIQRMLDEHLYWVMLYATHRPSWTPAWPLILAISSVSGAIR